MWLTRCSCMQVLKHSRIHSSICLLSKFLFTLLFASLIPTLHSDLRSIALTTICYQPLSLLDSIKSPYMFFYVLIVASIVFTLYLLVMIMLVIIYLLLRLLISCLCLAYHRHVVCTKEINECLNEIKQSSPFLTCKRTMNINTLNVTFSWPLFSVCHCLGHWWSSTLHKMSLIVKTKKWNSNNNN